MANTEKIGILKQVRNVEGAVTDALGKPILTQGQAKVLEDLLVVLREIDNLILLNELNECIEELKDKSKGLKKINGRIKRHIEKLEDISGKVEQASKVIDAVVKAFDILIKVGIA